MNAATPSLLAFVLATACLRAEETGAPAPATVRNLVLVTLDTVRADHLGCYGYFRDTTPRLDAFARDALLFERCLAPIAQTTPSHASLFTGVLPYEHGVLTNLFTRPDDQHELLALRTSATLRTLAQTLQGNGFRTGGFVAATPVKRATGLAAGFDVWTEPKSARRAGAEPIAEALRFLDERADSPFFVWIHLFDAHGPIRPPHPPEPYLARYRTDPALKAWLEARRFPSAVEGEHTGSIPPSQAHNLYDGALRFLDDQLEPLLARLDAGDLKATTAVVFVGDHGHGLGQHGHLNHGTCWDEQYRVPLLVRVPGVAPARIATLCSMIDVVPTLGALVPAIADESLLRQSRGANVLGADFAERPLFGMSPVDKGIVSLTTSRWKLIRRRDRAPELFDLEADPFELEDVAARHPETAAAMLTRIEREIERQQQAERLHHRDGATGEAIDPALLEELRALGYAGDDAPSGDGPAPGDER